MNDTSTVLQDKEELVREIDRFPIRFGTGGPGAVFDEVTIERGQRKARIATSLKDMLKGAALIPSVAPDLGRSMDRQIQSLVKDLEGSPGNVYLLTNLANTYLSVGAFDKAIECFESALEVDEGFRLAMIGLGKSYMIQDQPGEALRIYLDYAKKYPSDTRALVDLAHVYLRLGELDEARVSIERAISLRPDDPNAHHTSGIICVMRGEVDRAIAAFRRTTALDVRFAPAYSALGVCYGIKGSHTKSIKYLHIAYAIDPQGVYAAKNLAKAYEDRGDFEAAATLMTEYLKRYPRDLEAQNRLAYSYFSLGDYRRSLEGLRRLLGSVLETPGAAEKRAAILNNTGVVHLRMGAIPHAEDMFRKSLEAADRPNPVTYFNLTRMLIGAGRREEARRLIERYIAVAPGDNTPLLLLAQNYMHSGDYEKAREILRELLSSDPDSRDACLLLSSLHAEAFDDYDSAIGVLERFAARDKSDQVIRNDLAYCYLRKGLTEVASDILRGVNWDRAGFPLYATRGLLEMSRGNLRKGVRWYNMAVSKAANAELKGAVRQKRSIEAARYFFDRGQREEALRRLQSVWRVQTKTRLYLDQARRLLRQIEELPEQSTFAFRENSVEHSE